MTRDFWLGYFVASCALLGLAWLLTVGLEWWAGRRGK